MSKAFKDYAKIFDIIYRDKDYEGECDFLERIFKRYSRRPIKDVLDVACGTGSHIVHLAKRGFRISAQDLSPHMLELARKKCLNNNLKVEFMGYFPMQRFRHKRQFDAVIAMFSSIDYLTTDKDILRTFRNIRYCVRQGGIFTFDFWNKDCVIKNFSPTKENVYEVGDDRTVRSSTTVLDRKRDIAKIKYVCISFRKGKRIAQIEETHRMKYHVIKDMQCKLKESGFRVLDCFPFMKIGTMISNNDWNISIVATPREK